MKLLHKLLTAEKHIALLDRARHKSTREIERMVAQLAPKPFVAPMVRRLPSIIPLRITSPAEQAPATMMVRGSQESRATEAEQEFALDASPADTASAAPSSSDDRYLLRITIAGETKSKLERAGDLLRHTIPDADPAATIDRALTVLVEQLERTKIAATSRPRTGRLLRRPARPRRLREHRRRGTCRPWFVGSSGLVMADVAPLSEPKAVALRRAGSSFTTSRRTRVAVARMPPI